VFEHLHIDAESLIKYLENKGYSINRNVGTDKFSHEAVKT
jgi:predicted RNA binding protein YcfA (HicA-like mRNA interferase family)